MLKIKTEFSHFFLVMKMRKLAKSDLSRNQSVDFTGKEQFLINYNRCSLFIHNLLQRLQLHKRVSTVRATSLEQLSIAEFSGE